MSNRIMADSVENRKLASFLLIPILHTSVAPSMREDKSG